MSANDNPTSDRAVLVFKVLFASRSVPPIVTVPLKPAVPSDVFTKKFLVWIPEVPMVISPLPLAKPPSVSFVPVNIELLSMVIPPISPLVAVILPVKNTF